MTKWYSPKYVTSCYGGGEMNTPIKNEIKDIKKKMTNNHIMFSSMHSISPSVIHQPQTLASGGEDKDAGGGERACL